MKFKLFLKRFLAWIGAAAMLLAVVGCAKAPDASVIAKTNTEQIVSIATESQSTVPNSSTDAAGTDIAALREYYGVPERYTSEFSNADGKLTIKADVALTIPSVFGIPVVEVEAGNFSQELTTKAFRYFCNGISMIQQPEQVTKAGWEISIQQAQANAEAAADEETKAFWSKIVKQYEAEKAKAPESIPVVPCDGTLKTVDLYGDGPDSERVIGQATALHAVSEAMDANGGRTMFSVGNNGEYSLDSSYNVQDENGNLYTIAPRSRATMSFQTADASQHGPNVLSIINDSLLSNVTALSESGGTADGCILHTTPQQARQITQSMLDALGLNDFIIAGVYLYTNKDVSGRSAPVPTPTPSGASANGAAQNGNQPIVELERQMYSVRLLRAVNGVKVESTEDEVQIRKPGTDDTASWDTESCYVNIDDSGIIYFGWYGPHAIIKTVTENTELVSWTDVQEIFEKMVLMEYQALAKAEYNHSVVIDVERVELCLQRTIEQGSYTTGLLIPVWNFYGTTTITRANESGGIMSDGLDRIPLLSINAIDGNIINVSKGY